MEHGANVEHTQAHHPTVRTYTVIAVVLFVLTAIEVALYYMEDIIPHPLLIALLLGLSAGKFGFVIAYFMHLKFDSKWFSWLFLGGLFLAGSILLVLLALFRLAHTQGAALGN